MKKLTFDRLFNVGLLAILAFVVTLPGTPLRAKIRSWTLDREFSRLAANHWDSLSATSPRTGAEDGDLVVVEFGDYQCPFCRRAHAVLEELASKLPNFSVGYRHYPAPSIHPLAEAAAMASVCAEEQDRFEEMHSLLIETEDWLEDPVWGDIARQAGIQELAEFERCFSSERVEERIERDLELAAQLNVHSTPTFYFRQGAHVGYLDEPQMLELLGLETGHEDEG